MAFGVQTLKKSKSSSIKILIVAVFKTKRSYLFIAEIILTCLTEAFVSVQTTKYLKLVKSVHTTSLGATVCKKLKNFFKEIVGLMLIC